MYRLFLLVLLPSLLSTAPLDLIPTPKYVESLNREIRIPAGPARIHIAQPHLGMARNLIVKSFPEARFTDTGSVAEANIILWDYSAPSKPGVTMNFLDRRTLTDGPLHVQAYVLKVERNSLWVVGGGAAGVLYGAATAAQLLHNSNEGLRIDDAYIRDWPDFEFRAASDWLLAVELNRWALDRGQGMDAYAALARQKLDRAASYKINMALIDGFGWSLAKRPPEYPNMMRDLNQYARERGIRLLYGGYGAAYDIARRPAEYHGDVHLNRESYPDGPVYECMNYPDGKAASRTLGSCRSNEGLNREKGEELAHFVDAVEPGALYIHHEDCCVFEDFQKAWLGRCERCRRRWPNDSLTAPDGGAGALAHGYSSLIESVNRVKHPDRGYQASRDTEIILVSPVYMPASTNSAEWAKVLELWRSITLQLPRVNNVQICFREVLPQPGGGTRWIELFQSMMRQEKLPYGAFVFFAGGAEGFFSDYPMSGAPAMTAHFLGARSIYHSTGDFYREPMEIVAAEYAWNVRSTGFYRDPIRESDTNEIARWIYTPGEPPEIFGPGKLYDRICAKLYGEEAGKEMSRYYRLREWLPDIPEPARMPGGETRDYYRRWNPRYLPRTFNYVTALPEYWNYLSLESSTWTEKEANDTTRETHRRHARRWRLAIDLNARGKELVAAALAKHPRAEAVADLQFLMSLFEVYQPLIQALESFHAVLANPRVPDAIQLLDVAVRNARAADALAAQRFPTPVDPAMGEVRSLRKYPAELAAAIEALRSASR